MAFTFDSTVGGTSASSLVSTNDAQDIINATPNSTAWGSDTDLQEVWLSNATAMLNVIAWQGSKVAVTQACSWPRSWVVDPDFADIDSYPGPFRPQLDTWPGYLSTTEIPRRIKRACVMLALQIARAGTSDVWAADDTASLRGLGVGPIRMDFAPLTERKQGLRALPSVWREIYALTLAGLGGEVARG